MSNDGMSIGGATCLVGAGGLVGVALQHPAVRYSGPDEVVQGDEAYIQSLTRKYNKYADSLKINKMNVGDTFNEKALTKDIKAEAEVLVKTANKKMLKGGLIGAGIALAAVILDNVLPLNKNKDPHKAYLKDVSFSGSSLETKEKLKLTEQDLMALAVPGSAPAVAAELVNQGKLSKADSFAFMPALTPADMMMKQSMAQLKIEELRKQIQEGK